MTSSVKEPSGFTNTQSNMATILNANKQNDYNNSHLSPVTINFLTPPVRCKVYQPMEVRYNGVRVTPGPLTGVLKSFNSKTPKAHVDIDKMDSNAYQLVVKVTGNGGMNLRFPVAGVWNLTVEYGGHTCVRDIEVHGQRGKFTKMLSKMASNALMTSAEPESDDSNSHTSPVDDKDISSPDSLDSSSADIQQQQAHTKRSRRGYETSSTSNSNIRRPGYNSSSSSSVNNSTNYYDDNQSSQDDSPTPTGAELFSYPTNVDISNKVPEPWLQPPLPLESAPSIVTFSDAPSNNDNLQNRSLAHDSTPSYTYSDFGTISFDAAEHYVMEMQESKAVLPTNPYEQTEPTFAYNNVGQFATPSHMKLQDSELNYIPQNASFYPLPADLNSDAIQSNLDSSSMNLDANANASLINAGYPYVFRIVPPSTTDVVSWGQEACLMGKNLMPLDHGSTSVFFTLEINKMRVKAPSQYANATTHIALIPPLSYYGIAYSRLALKATVELYQGPHLVPIEQTFYYVSTPGQVQQGPHGVTVGDQGYSSHFSNFQNDGAQQGGNGHNHNSPFQYQTYAGDYNSDQGQGSYGGGSFFYNTGIPLINSYVVDGNLFAIKHLVSLGAEPNRADIWGVTPLHLAIFFGQKEIASYLLELGVSESLQTEDINGDTPLDLVIRHWNPQIRALYDTMVSLLETKQEKEIPNNAVINKNNNTFSAVSESSPPLSLSQDPITPNSSSSKENIDPSTSSPSTQHQQQIQASTSVSTVANKKSTLLVPSLSSPLPFSIDGQKLTITSPKFWNELAEINRILFKSEKPSISNLDLNESSLSQWSKLPSITSIDTSRLGLESFPQIPVSAFPVLQELNLSFNSIRIVPPELAEHKYLRSINLSDNLIDILPHALATMEPLQDVQYDNNPLKLMPLQPSSSKPVLPTPSSNDNLKISTNDNSSGVAMRGSLSSSSKPASAQASWKTEPLFQYLASLSSSSSQSITENKIRVNIFGDSYNERRLLQHTLQVDFDSFMTRLRYKVPKFEASDSFSIEDFANKHSKNAFSFQTWTAGARHPDFASLALVSPGIQIVLFSLSKTDAKSLVRIQYWLESVKRLSYGMEGSTTNSASSTGASASLSSQMQYAERVQNSSFPILLVACDYDTLPSSAQAQASMFLDRVSSLASTILHSRGFVASRDIIMVSFQKGSGIDTLKSRIAKVTTASSISPTSYQQNVALLLATIMRISEMRWFLTRSEFNTLASQFGMDTTNQETFDETIKKLIALGGCVHIARQGIELENFIFTNPQRLSHALTNFYCRYQRLIKGGILYLEDCNSQLVSMMNGTGSDNLSSFSQTIPSSFASTISLDSSQGGRNSPPLSSYTSPPSSPSSSIAATSTSSISSSDHPSPVVLRKKSLPTQPIQEAPSLSLPVDSSSSIEHSNSISLTLPSQSSSALSSSPLPMLSRTPSIQLSSVSGASSTVSSSPIAERKIIEDIVLLELLVWLGEAVKVSNQRFLFPNRLAEAPAGHLDEPFKLESPNYFDRLFTFSGPSVSQKTLNRLYAHLYCDPRIQVCSHYSSEMIVRYFDEYSRIMIPSASSSIILRVSGNLPNRLLPILTTLVIEVIRVTCPHSLLQVVVQSPSLPPTITFTVEEVLDAICDGQPSISHGNAATVKLENIAPDMCLQDLMALEVEENSLTSSTSPGQSIPNLYDNLENDMATESFSLSSLSTAASPSLSTSSPLAKPYLLKKNLSWWHGKLRMNDDVNIAYFHTSVSPSGFKSEDEFMADVSRVYIQSLSRCVWNAQKFNQLQHPLIARLLGFNLTTQSLAIESSPHGTLKELISKAQGDENIKAKLSFEWKLRVMIEIVMALAWIHSNHLQLPKLSIEDILITSIDVNATECHAKICDLSDIIRLPLPADSHPRMQRYLRNDYKRIAIILYQLWTLQLKSPDSKETPSIKSNNNIGNNNSFNNNPAIETQVQEIINACFNNTDYSFSIHTIQRRLELICAQNNWTLLLPNNHHLALSSSSNEQHYPYFSVHSSIRIVEHNEIQIASISGLTRTLNGMIWIGSASGLIYVWNPQRRSNKKPQYTIQTFTKDARESRRRINALMATGSFVWCISDGGICVFNAADGSLHKSITHKQSLCMAQYQIVSSQQQHQQQQLASQAQSALESSISSTLVYIGGAHGEISVWKNNEASCLIGTVLENRLPITAISVTARHVWVGIGISKRTCHIVVLDRETLKEAARIPAHEDLVTSIIPVGNSHIWTSSMDEKINVWNIHYDNNQRIMIRLEKSLLAHRKPVLEMADYTPPGSSSPTTIYSCDSNGIIEWDAKTCQLLDRHVSARHRGPVVAVHAVDSSSFISGSVDDGCICLWKRKATQQP